MSRLGHLVRELRRRRVVRVAVVYLVAAWGVIEVSDTILPNIGAPEGSVAAVIALAALGLPVAIVLSWFFDVTPDGVERTTSDQSPRAPRSSGQRWMRLAIVFTGVAVPVGLGGWYAMARAREPKLDDDLVAIMPFRTAGTAPELELLREGVQVLVSRALWGEQGLPVAVEPLRIDRALRDYLGSRDVDPDEEQATRIARLLGAGRLITGEIVGDRSAAVFHFAVHDARQGRVLHRDAIRSHPDSIEYVAGLIAARLMAAEAGLPPDRLSAVSTRSPDALRAYLEGEAAQRRGRHARSQAAFDLALEVDSTFLLAAMGMIRSSGWENHLITPAHRDRAFRIAYERSDELPPRDRLYLRALDPHRPGLAWRRDLIQARELAVQRYPASTDLKFLLAEAYFWSGHVAGHDDPWDRSQQLLEEIVAVDSAHYDAIHHLLFLAEIRRDHAGLARWGDLLLAIDSTSPLAVYTQYYRSRIPAIGRPGRQYDLDTLPAAVIVEFGQPRQFPELLVEGSDAALRALDRARNARDLHMLRVNNFLRAVHEGRASTAHAMLDQLPGNTFWNRRRLMVALVAIPDSVRAARAAERVRQNLAELSAAPAAEDVGEYAAGACLLVYHHLFAGRTEDAVRAARAIDDELAGWTRRFPRTDENAAAHDAALVEAQICGALAESVARTRAASSDADSRLAAVDELLQRAPAVANVVVANALIARSWEEIGQPRRALAAIRRNSVELLDMMNAIGEQARLADQLGMREEALELYSDYVASRQRPEPPFDDDVRRAHQRIAALAAELRS